MANKMEKSSYGMYDTDSAEWKQYSFETMAESVIFNDGKNAEEKLGNFDTNINNTVNNLETKIDSIEDKMGAVQFKYNTETGAPMWSTDGVNWYFFKHWHIGSAGVPDETLTDDTTLTEAAGCFTKIQYKYHTHSSSCYTEQRHGNMHVVDDNGAVYWQCSICGATQSGNATDAAGSHPCYNTSTVLICGKTEESVEKTYYVCDCGKLAGSYTTKL